MKAPKVMRRCGPSRLKRKIYYYLLCAGVSSNLPVTVNVPAPTVSERMFDHRGHRPQPFNIRFATTTSRTC